MPYITPAHVIPTDNPSTYSIRKMEAVLARQGQIEPLQVRKIRDNGDGTETYAPFEQDAWGSEIVLAARNLGWSHILIVITDRYEA